MPEALNKALRKAAIDSLAQELVRTRPKPKPKKRETNIERAYCDWHKRHKTGALLRKMNGLGFRDWPDRLTLKPKVLTPLWIEFKRPGKTSTDGQLRIQKMLTALGHSVHECTDAQAAVEIYEGHGDEFYRG